MTRHTRWLNRWIGLYTFVWRIPPFRPLLRFLGVDYNRFMMLLLGTTEQFEQKVTYVVERRFWFGCMNLDLAKPTQRSLYFERTYERALVGVMRRHLPDGSTFVDIGAHVGYYSLIASKLVGSQGHVVSLEPDPANFAHLKRHIERNRASNVVALNCAASEANGEMDLLINPFNDGGHSLHQFPGYSPTSVTRVRTTRIDDVVGRHTAGSRVYLAKIDVEGHQLYVLRGMRDTITASRPHLIVEINGDQADTHEVIEMLGKAGYTYTRLDEFNFHFIPREGGTV